MPSENENQNLIELEDILIKSNNNLSKALDKLSQDICGDGTFLRSFLEKNSRNLAQNSDLITLSTCARHILLKLEAAKDHKASEVIRIEVEKIFFQLLLLSICKSNSNLSSSEELDQLKQQLLEELNTLILKIKKNTLTPFNFSLEEYADYYFTAQLIANLTTPFIIGGLSFALLAAFHWPVLIAIAGFVTTSFVTIGLLYLATRAYEKIFNTTFFCQPDDFRTLEGKPPLVPATTTQAFFAQAYLEPVQKALSSSPKP